MMRMRHRLHLLNLTVAVRSLSCILGDAPAVVSLTSYGTRLQNVHYTIQSIVAGTARPRRIILWVGHGDADLITPALRSLERRGLEIRMTEDYGPHTKYYPYCAALPKTLDTGIPLVTADDDILYSDGWLGDLLDTACTEKRAAIVAHRAHRIKFNNDAVAPYMSWGIGCGTVEPSYENVATGVSGVLYPASFTSQVVGRWGTIFQSSARSADDLWLHTRSVLLGIPTRQVRPIAPPIVEHHSHAAGAFLAQDNTMGGLNDIAAQKIYTPELIRKIRRGPDTTEPYHPESVL